MLPFRRTFENEKLQLQELNHRLGQYLSRVKQLEQENSVLIAEINATRHARGAEWEKQYKAEVRELRSAVGQLALDMSKAEVQRDKLRREAQLLEALLRQESGLRRDIDGELGGCKAQLQQSHVDNVALEERLLALENEYVRLEDEHGHEMARLREALLFRGAPAALAPGPSCHALPAVTVEEVERYALGLSDSCAETFEMYCRRVQELEECVRADEAKLQELEREKMRYAAELEELRCRAEQESRAQPRLEEQLASLRERAEVELEHYQVMIEELEQERILLANAIAEKLKEHQELMQVKIGLALEVATYRALLEGEQKDIYLQIDRYAGEAPRKIGSSVTRQERRKFYPVNTGFESRYMEQTTRVKTTPVSTQFTSSAVSRALPVTVPGRDYRSPPNRRDMLAFSKSEVATSSVKPDSSDIRKNTVEEKVVRIKEMSQNSFKKGVANKLSPISSPTLDQKEINVEESNKKYVRVVSPPMMSLNAKSEEESEQKVLAGKVTFKKEADMKVAGKQGEIPAMAKLENVQGFQNVTEVTKDHLAKKEPQYDASDYSQVKDKSDRETKALTREDKIVEMVCLEEIIEKVMKPAGLDTKLSTSPDSKVVFHVEKTEEEDGTARTQIILESKVEEDLDVSDDSVLDELLSKGVKKVTLEDIKGTPTGSMIESLLSFGLEKGDGLESKSVNVEIIEEPLEAYSDEESDVKPKSVHFQPSSKYVKIEELDNDPQTAVHFGHSAGVLKTSTESGKYRKDESVQMQESPKDSPYFTQIQETEYFVSTPDDASEPEESSLSSYGHYRVVDDLSDEKYYQPESSFDQRFEELDSYKGAAKITDMTSEHAFSEHRYPECIIEEEIQVYPTVQKSILEQLQEETKDPQQQLTGVLKQVQGEVSGTLKEELSFFTRNDQESSDKLAVDIKKVQQGSDNKTMTIVAEVNVSQTLEDPRLLKEQGMSEEQVIQYDDPDLEHISSRGASISVGGMQEGYTVKVSKDQSMKVQGMPWVSGNKGQGVGSVNEVNKLKTHVEVGPPEKSFGFRSDVSTSGIEEGQASYSQTRRSEETSGIEMTEDVYSYVQSGTAGEHKGEAFSQSLDEGKMGKWEDYTKAPVEFGHVLKIQITQPQIKTSQEKNVYFENPDED
ncbi:synemin-like [Scleropages formosus]|uniref:Synemin-like n=1 Tax=Scleropages formosus TaxID=113540 RepID=A0A8C9TLV0_SCLFO|nr:synemin-like [Scleropages formosus]